MPRWLIALALTVSALVLPGRGALGQTQPPSDKFLVDAGLAHTWNDGISDIIQLQGPVTIQLDRMELSALNAVIWLSPEPGLVLGQERVEIALLGDAVVKQPSRGITRSGGSLFVTVSVRGRILISADQRLTSDDSNTPLYARAAALRTQATSQVTGTNQALKPSISLEAEAQKAGEEPAPQYVTEPGATTRPARKTSRITFSASRIENVDFIADDGTQALELSGNVIILQTLPDTSFVELRADRAVLFTRSKTGAPASDLENNISAAYLEGDVRIDSTPPPGPKTEQRLWAERVYYDFDKSEAVLTDAMVRTEEQGPAGLLPITIRARKLRQLSQDDYRGEHVELSTSSFATPTYSVKTDEVYVSRNVVVSSYTNQPEQETDFVATGDTLNFFDVPVFYYPKATGSINNDPFPLRTLSITSTDHFGFGATSTYGLFESLGRPHPKNLDISFLADYFDRRGPATGLNGEYSGTNIDQDNSSLSDYSGRFKSFIISDRATDILGGSRTDVSPPDELRGKFLFEHQQFLPDHWQVQLRYGYSSDPTFLEEYYPSDFFENQPYDAVAYAKRQQDTEALTLLANADTNRFVTTSDQQKDQFDVEHLPEVGYRRIGDSLADDNLTFYSENTVDRLRFDKSHFSLDDQGFVGFTPGTPNEGYTGTETSPVYRGDTSQEVDYPIQLGQIKMVPYTSGRLTAYSDSPGGDPINRVYGSSGVRFTTDFWKVDNAVQSELFDLNRMRHVIEPEINLYTSGTTEDRDKLFIYDENVDGIADISAADFELHQRWETYRGAPGKQSSVDFFTLNVSADAYTNPPTDAALLPTKFRGLYFPSDPAASIPRDSINSDATWLISNSTAILADMQYNVDHAVLATGSIGLAVNRLDRLSYYAGLRYIEQLNSNLATGAIQYQLTTKYSFELSQTYDFGQRDVSTDLTIRRQFDRLTLEVGVFHDSISGNNGFKFNLIPTGLVQSSPDIAGFFSQPH